ncbi:ACT domain-containing protein [Auriculariales sp. MPI-PUGE-AT-0066]|nr:ACT domain-containing protein [Auriculariales sp. MPI-PUGE-AT-0066]
MPPPSPSPALHLQLLSQRFAVFQLAANERPPPGLLDALCDPANQKFVSITRANDELSIVCDRECLTEGDATRAPEQWMCIKVVGPMDLGLTGILSSMTAPLRVANVPIFVVSTWNTDWLLVNASKGQQAVAALKADGWTFRN